MVVNVVKHTFFVCYPIVNSLSLEIFLLSLINCWMVPFWGLNVNICLLSTCSGSIWLVTATVVTASLSELGRAQWPSTMFVLENARYSKKHHISEQLCCLTATRRKSPNSSFWLLYPFIVIHPAIIICASFHPSNPSSLHPLIIFCNLSNCLSIHLYLHSFVL